MRHLRWLIPAVLAPTAYFAFMAMATTRWAAMDASPQDPGPALEYLGLTSFALAVPLICLIVAVRQGVKVYGAARRARGRFTTKEKAGIARIEASRRAWLSAGILRESLLRREVPPTVAVWDVVARPGEVFFADTTADYSRFYGTDVSYYQTSGFYFGHPLFVAAGLVANSVGNAGRRSAAENAAATQWRDQRAIRMLVSNERILCSGPEGWLSFDWAAVSAIYPDPRSWTLTLEFPSTSPLMLRGEWVPYASVFAVMAAQGLDALRDRPEMKQLG